MWLTLKVAALLDAEVPRSEIALRLDVTPMEVKRAIARLDAIADKIADESGA